MWAKVETVNSRVIDNFINNVINKSIVVWDYSEPNINYFKKKDVIVPIIHVPLGYTTAIDYCSSHPNIIKDVPSVFIGNVCLRRVNILDNIIRQDIKPFISIFNNNLWNNEHSIVGDKTNMKCEVLCRTKIGLDISIPNRNLFIFSNRHPKKNETYNRHRYPPPSYSNGHPNPSPSSRPI